VNLSQTARVNPLVEGAITHRVSFFYETEGDPRLGIQIERRIKTDDVKIITSDTLQHERETARGPRDHRRSTEAVFCHFS
jgi:hypothetical protein